MDGEKESEIADDRIKGGVAESAVFRARRRRESGIRLARCHAEMPLIDTAEVLRVAEPEGVGHLAYGVTAGQHLVGPRHQEPLQEHRGRKYNPLLDPLQALTDEMKAIGEKYGASCSQIGIAWAIAKGTMPIVGATKERHVVEAAAAADIALTAEEVARMETLADATGIDTRGDWEHTME